MTIGFRYSKSCEALSVTCGDSSPRGRAKALSVTCGDSSPEGRAKGVHPKGTCFAARTGWE